MGESQKYWDNGLPFEGLRSSTGSGGDQTYWDNGLPQEDLFPGIVVSDNIAVSESSSASIASSAATLEASTTDSLTISEQSSVFIPAYKANVSDSVVINNPFSLFASQDAANVTDSHVGQYQTKHATRFLAPSSGTISRIVLPLCKQGSPAQTLTAAIYSDSATTPGSLVGTASNSVSGSAITSCSDYTQVVFDGVSAAVTASSYYWVVIEASSNDTSNYYYWPMSTYSTTYPTYNYSGSSWTLTDNRRSDFYLYVQSLNIQLRSYRAINISDSVTASESSKASFSLKVNIADSIGISEATLSLYRRPILLGYEQYRFDTTGNHSITVPADCTLILAMSAYFWATGDSFLSANIGSNYFTKAIEQTSLSGNYGQSAVLYLLNPPTGAQTITTAFQGNHDTANVTIAYFKGVNLTKPIRDTDSQYAATDRSTYQTITSDAMDCEKGDLLIGTMFSYQQNPNMAPAGSGQTEMFDQYGASYLQSVGYKLIDSGTTTTIKGSGAFPCISAVILSAEAVTFGINVSDNISTSEYSSPNISIAINVSDNVSTSEYSFPSIATETTIIEDIELNTIPFAVAHSNVAVDDAPLAILSVLRVSISDSISTEDAANAIQVFRKRFTSVDDAVTASDDSTVVQVFRKRFASVDDAVSIVDAGQSLIKNYVIQVSDAITASDASQQTATPIRVTASEALQTDDLVAQNVTPLRIFISDVITMSDEAYGEVSAPSFSTLETDDPLAVLDDSSVRIFNLVVAVADQLAVSDSVDAKPKQLKIIAEDAIVTADISIALIKNVFISVADNLAIFDTAAELLKNLDILALESISIADTTDERLQTFCIEIDDAISVSEQSNASANPLRISCSDSITAEDVPDVYAAAASYYTLSADDIVALTDASIAFVPSLNIRVTDGVSMNDAEALLFDKLFVAISDALSITDEITANVRNIFVSISDSISITDYLQTLISKLHVAVDDAVTAGELLSILMGAPSGLYTSVEDSIELHDAIEALLKNLNVLAADGVSLSELVDSLRSYMESVEWETILTSDVAFAEIAHQLGVRRIFIQDTARRIFELYSQRNVFIKDSDRNAFEQQSQRNVFFKDEDRNAFLIDS